MSGISQYLKNISTSTLLYMSFGVGILMLLVLGVVRGYELEMASEQIELVINDRMVKIKNAAIMRYSARERTLGLHRMILTGDAFSRDEQWLSFNRFGGEFARARLKILSMPLNAQEQDMMALQGRLTREALAFQERVIELIEKGQLDTARKVLQRGASPAQNKVIKQLDEFYEYQEEQAERARQRLFATYEKLQSILFAVTVVFVVICSLLALFVTRTVKLREARLIRSTQAARQAGYEQSQLIGKCGLSYSQQLHGLEGDVEYAISVAREHNQFNKYVLAHLGEAVAKARYMNSVAEVLVELARLETGEEKILKEDIAVYPLVQDIVEHLKPMTLRNNNTINLQCSDRIGVVISDRNRLSAMLESLLTHTCSYTEYGMITLNVQREKDGVVFRIEDTGKGIAPEDIKGLFNAFSDSSSPASAAKQRYALNLALQRRICQILGGELIVKTEQNIGTTCSVRLPQSQ